MHTLHGGLPRHLSFQAPDLYPRCGYEVFGRLEGFPTGHARLFMRKTPACCHPSTVDRAERSVKSNPSLNRVANGGPSGPAWRYAASLPLPGPGVLPSLSAFPDDGP